MQKTPIEFQHFNPYEEVRIYHSATLPHWRQNGCTYFVTFRLADSLPKSVLVGLKEKRDAWLKRHDINPDNDNWQPQFAKLPEEKRRDYERQIANNLNIELDQGYGSCVLRSPEIYDIVATALDFHHSKQVWTGDYVIMPNHVHVLLTPAGSHELEEILKSIKSFTAGKINRALGQKGTFWQRDNYDHIVRDSKQLGAFQKYIAGNPGKAKLRKGTYCLATAEYTFDP